MRRLMVPFMERSAWDKDQEGVRQKELIRVAAEFAKEQARISSLSAAELRAEGIVGVRLPGGK